MKRLTEFLLGHEQLRKFIDDNRGQLKKLAVVAVLVVAALGVYAFGGNSKTPEIAEESKAAEVEEVSTTTIFVDIGGAVAKPMLAELPEGSRVEDAIQAAGGLTEDADLTSINRAEFLEDGQKVYIPAFASEDEAVSQKSAPAVSSGTDANGKVNINSADSETLQTLNGVGPATAQKIIDYRETEGRFMSIEDLKNVSGIGDKTFEKLKDYIIV
ncbi:MAG: helix-hairpin-helix domain-containing protein [Clostridia bacterium]|nr:helix-hairpin-helix domain-containing protein [Clostridia bacterium]